MVRWKLRSVPTFTYCVIVSVLFCDWYLFPILFSNVVHSRYFSMQCKDKNDSTCNELNDLFATRKRSCDKIAKEYWMKQPIKLSTKRDEQYSLKEYWSSDMAEYLEYNKQPRLDMLVMVISVRRRLESYLHHTTKLLHNEIHKQSRGKKEGEMKNVNLVICNSDAEPEIYKEATYLSQFIDVISINRTKRSHKCCPAEDCDYEKQTTNGKAKEIADYYECLREAKTRYIFKYILVLEDDAEAATSDTLQRITYSVIPLVMEQNPDVIYSKLIHSFGYHGFSKSFETIVEITTFVLLTSIIVYGLLWAIDTRPSSQRLTITIVITVLALWFVIVLGRQSTLLALKTLLVPYRISKAHGDQTTAILYPRTKVDEVLYLFENRFICISDGSLEQEVAIDIQLSNVIEEQYNSKNVMIWTHGHFFNHIGFYTSLQFKDEHVAVSEFAAGYIKLPNRFCHELI